MIVTDSRIIDLDKTLIVRDARDAIDLSQIQDTIMKQNGLLHTILNYGDITVTLSAINVEKRFKSLPNPDYYFRKINKTKREAMVTYYNQPRGELDKNKFNAPANIKNTATS